ncbi:MAG: hypothetical protein AB4063_24875 [Crocosphaera sp.]
MSNPDPNQELSKIDDQGEIIPQQSSNPSEKSSNIQTSVMPFNAEQVQNIFGDLFRANHSNPEPTFMPGVFIINQEGIGRLYDQIVLWVDENYHKEPVNFMLTLTFEDDSSDTIHGIYEMYSYSEYNKLICKKLDLTWIYWIQFPGKNFPEKQEILLSFDSECLPPKNNKTETPEMIFNELDYDDLSYLIPGSIILKIDHSNDIFYQRIKSLLITECDSFLNEVPKDLHFFEEISKQSMMVSFFEAGLFTIFVFTSTQEILESDRKEVLNFEGVKSSSEQFSIWLESLSIFNNFFDYNQNLVHFLFLPVIFGIFCFMIFFLYQLNKRALPDLYRRSFIRLTDSSEKDYNLCKNNRNPGIWGVVSCIVMGAIGSLVASAILALFSN